MWDLLTIDPGKHFTGLALWQGQVLRKNAVLANSREITSNLAEFMNIQMVKETVVEDQYYDKRTHKSVSPILELAFWAGAYTIASRPLDGHKRVKPIVWKGTVPKDVMCRRIISRLMPEERDAVAPPGQLLKFMERRSTHMGGARSATKKLTDKIDAVGIGLWYYDRL